MCIWNTLKSRLSISKLEDIGRFLCTFDEEADDVKSMVSLAKSIGGCATGGVASCIVATVEIGLLLSDPACRPSWMNACFFSTDNLDQQAIEDMENRAASDSRFVGTISGSFKKDLNWHSRWELRWMNFNFEGNRVVTIYHLTYKPNSSFRYTNYYDPDNMEYAGWIQAGVIAR